MPGRKISGGTYLAETDNDREGPQVPSKTWQCEPAHCAAWWPGSAGDGHAALSSGL